MVRLSGVYEQILTTVMTGVFARKGYLRQNSCGRKVKKQGMKIFCFSNSDDHTMNVDI